MRSTLLCSFVLSVVWAGELVLFSEKGTRGLQSSHSHPDFFCHDLPDFLYRTRSIRLIDGKLFPGCVALYSRPDCQGRRVQVKTKCGGESCCPPFDLSLCGFDRQTASYAFC